MFSQLVSRWAPACPLLGVELGGRERRILHARDEPVTVLGPRDLGLRERARRAIRGEREVAHAVGVDDSYGREAATGRGCVVMFEESAEKLGLDPKETTFIVQGFGNVGSWIARIMQDRGSKLVGVADAVGAVRSDAGIDAHALTAHVHDEGGKLAEFPGVEAIPTGDFFETPCDVFFPAALGGMVHEDNAGLLNCKLMIEGANSPTTFAADEILAANGVTVVPDLMANAGGVVASYFEWVQNLQHFRWEEAAVNDMLRGIMRRAYGEVSERAESNGQSLREAAFEIGIERVVEASRTRGYFS